MLSSISSNVVPAHATVHGYSPNYTHLGMFSPQRTWDYCPKIWVDFSLMVIIYTKALSMINLHPFLLPNPAFSFLITEGNRTWSSGVGLSCPCTITSPLRSWENPEQITEPSNFQCSHPLNSHKDGTCIYMSGTEKVFKKWWLSLSLPPLLPNRMVPISHPLESKFSWC